MANSLFHHEEIYRGQDLINRLAKTQLTVCGCGAIGSNLIDTLVRQGFRNIKVIDMDRVETHNISTQIFEKDDVGSQKVAAMANKAFRIANIEIEEVFKKLDSSNVKKLLKGSSLVVDAFDNSESRKLVQDECGNKIPCIHLGLSDTYGEVAWNNVYQLPKNVEGDVCDYPLARNLITTIVSIGAEEIQDFCLSKKPRLQSWSFTLKDMKIGKY